MITLKQSGQHRLIETKNNTKILYLDDSVYAWVEPPSLGEILVSSHKTHKADCVLSVGGYRLFTVQDEPNLSDNMHLELEVGRNIWQSYLLLTGLPTSNKIRARIIPTTEVIMGNPMFANIETA
ncbi:hypothetical protein EOM57_01420 [Candidatus Saccharibacteria bacterium]|nr:hypothetical protein [Candidatus Saccharibacteria bacterium]NCU38951.1 hypothetical protein [Candidatus Saccharibacteria bacterium]